MADELTDEELQIILKARLEADEIDEEMKKIGERFDALGTDAGKKMSEHVIESIRKQNEELVRQEEMMKVLRDPAKITQIVRAEGQKLEMQKEYNKLLDAERKKQGVGDSGKPDAQTLLAGIFGGGGMGGIGSMIGEVVGGPAGAIVGKFAGEMAQAVFTAPAKLAMKAMTGMANSLQELGGQLGPVSIGFDVLSGGLGTLSDAVKSIPIIGDLLGPFTDAAAAIPGILKDMTKTLTSFAGVASPTTLRLFMMSVEDVQATVGRAFIPMVEAMREGVRAFGDVAASVLPNTQEVREAMAGLRVALREVYNVARQLAAEIGPDIRRGILEAIRGLGEIARQMVPHVRELAIQFRDIYEAFRPLMDIQRELGINLLASQLHLLAFAVRAALAPIQGLAWIMRQLGLVRPLGPAEARPIGQAFREPHFSSFDEYQRQLQLSALREPGQPTMQQLPTTVSSISVTLERIREFIADLPRKIGVELRGIFFPNPAAQAARGAAIPLVQALQQLPPGAAGGVAGLGGGNVPQPQGGGQN